jgi:hypothetical protein
MESSAQGNTGCRRRTSENSMKRLCLLLCFVVIALGRALSQETNLSGTWLPEKLRWQAAPRSISRNLRSSQTELLWLAKDGDLAIIDCTIYQQGSKLTISAGDPEGVYIGKWHGIGLEIAIDYRLAYRTIQLIGAPPEKEHHDILQVSNGRLVFHGKSFRREPQLDAGGEREFHGAHDYPVDE